MCMTNLNILAFSIQFYGQLRQRNELSCLVTVAC
uniref:Uncharacterized protein n=1 Tax=Rhizophora mucronata TaxID=61149 RepID=A0A2P2QZR2_RHIMU